MKKRFIAILLIGSSLLCVGCSKDVDESKDSDHDISALTPVIEEVEPDNASGDDDDSTTDPDTSKDDGASIEDNLEIGDITDVVTINGTQLQFTEGDNEFTAAVVDANGSDVASLVFDLNNDGANEAFVVVGFDDGSNLGFLNEEQYWFAESFWYVDSNLSAKELTEYEGMDIDMNQYMNDVDGSSYITLNYQEGITPYGDVYFVENNQPTKVTGDITSFGGKYFGEDNELLSVEYISNSWIEVTSGEKIRNGLEMGGDNFPVRYILSGSSATQLGYTELKLDEVNIMAVFPDEDTLNAVAAYQFIYRDNGELDISLAIEKNGEVDFYTSIYFLSADNQWEFKTTLPGFYEEADAPWDYLDTTAK